MTAPLPIGTPAPPRALLIDDFTQSPHSLADLARTHRMTIPAMLKWAQSPLNQRTLQAIRDLTDARTDLIVSNARSEAAHALRRLAVESDSAETQRKACVDLLRLGLPAAPARARTPKDSAPQEPGPDPDGLRRLLDAFAVQADHEATQSGGVEDGPAVPSEHAA